ncbi:ABC transporter substrate-binding protein [Microbacterium gilvum]|uniref:ABC transporter substrate-binding protein n=1 Tax=Microbacterium gilvum TaxID=1336204 RepID=A0ABP9ABC9_9MICO
MTLTRSRTFAAALAAGALLLSGCAASAAPAEGSSTEPVSGGTLVHALPALDAGWQQQAANNWYKSQVWAQLVETLVYVDADGTVHPWLAESWEQSDDGLVYTFHLRDDVTFSDGTALTAETVARNLDVLGLGDVDQGIARSPMIPLEYVAAEAVDALTVEVTLSSPNGGFLPSLGFFAAGILGDATLDLPLEGQSDIANVVGTGPFVFESEEAERSIDLVRRDDYDWASDAFEHEGAAYLDGITFTVLSEDGARLGALESNQIDSLHYVQPSEEERLEADGWNVVHAPYFGTPINFVLRPETAILSDERVRQALQIGIDRQELVDTVYNAAWKPATSSIQQASPGWVDLSEQLAYDPDGAAHLLEDAGWEEGADGIREKDGERLVLPGYTSPNLNTTPQLLELIAQQLREIGVDLEITQTDASTYGEIFASAETPLIPTANTFLDPATLRQYWGVDATNQFKLTSDVLEPLLADVAQTTASTAERDEALRILQETTVSEAYTVPLVDNYQVYVTGEQVHGLTTNAVGRPYFYDTWKG